MYCPVRADPAIPKSDWEEGTEAVFSNRIAMVRAIAGVVARGSPADA
jgi:hypothetical protein